MLYLIQGFYFVLNFVWSQRLNILTRLVIQGYPKDYVLVQDAPSRSTSVAHMEGSFSPEGIKCAWIKTALWTEPACSKQGQTGDSLQNSSIAQSSPLMQTQPGAQPSASGRGELCMDGKETCVTECVAFWLYHKTALVPNIHYLNLNLWRIRILYIVCEEETRLSHPATAILL